MPTFKLFKFAVYLVFVCSSGLLRAEKAPLAPAAPEYSDTMKDAMIVTYDNGETSEDPRINYELELLTLALEKTKEKFGAYKLKPSPHSINYHRALVALKSNRYENFIRSFAYRKIRTEDQDLIYIDFPIDLGLLGYRICFVSKPSKEAVAKAKTLEDLKQFTHGQGVKWVDASILKKQGFKVIESATYEGLFEMININRIDLFCRGIGELAKEYELHRHLENLEVDQSFAFHYAFPLYFMTHKSNLLLRYRIEVGLKAAFDDGSLQKLWKKHYQESIEQAKLNHRKIYTLKNHTLDELPDNYSKYFVDIKNN